ncbi:MAG: 50S ribosomal protein L11 methyltransferase [Ilumatobacter sp.]|uniref:50S ribosomal protein L11 methyltransferase n=1 Tax=uncultured Ilumatobacter sp. TaxID=879968 RepID=UPI00359106CA
MTNKTFHVTVPESDEELAADRLWQLGVEAVGIGQVVDGMVELWTSVGATEESIRRAVDRLDPTWTWRTADVVTPVETWREHVGPTWYGKTGVVVPQWQADRLDAGADVLVTLIEPASSFGLGDHPTTRLSLGTLTDYLAGHHVSSVLDVGCGSGVLGIVAAQRGVTTIRSTDISAGAVEATVANARLNGVIDQIEVDMAELATISGPYDVVVANILAPVLVSMAVDLRRLTAADGVLIISGILGDDHQHVIDALAPMQVEHATIDAGWASIQLTHVH